VEFLTKESLGRDDVPVVGAEPQAFSQEGVDAPDVSASSKGRHAPYDGIVDDEMLHAAKLSLEIIGTAGFDGYLRQLNAGAEKILGYSREELISNPFVELVHADDRAPTAEAVSMLTRGAEVAHFQNRYRCKDGSYRWLHWQARSSTAKELIYFAARDITEQKAAAEGLRKQEEQYRLLFETNPSPMWVFDTATLRILAVNEAAVAQYGYSRAEFLKLYLRDLRPSDDVPELMQALSPLGTPAHFSGQFRHIKKDGSLIVVEIHSGPIVWEGVPARIVTAIDVTERKRSEERLREQADMLNRAHDAIIVRNFDDRRVVFWNSGAERLYGWGAGEAIGQTVGELILANPQELEAITKTLESSGEFRGQLKEITKDGRALIVDVWSTLIRNSDGSPRSVMSINNDITEQKKLESQLLRAQRLESIGTLASGVAHDLNNVLTPILMCAEVLRTNADPGDTESAISLIEESARRGAGIIKQVLTFARGVEGERVLINPSHLLEEMADIARKTFPKAIEISSRYPEDIWSIQGDPTQLHQVLLNLSVNARDAMPNGGSLAFWAENFEMDEHYASMMPDAKAGRYVALRVSDTGTGMPRATIEKIFDPFFTTKEVGKGTGLGLSTALGILKSHAGFISVYSEQNKGTTFKLFFPAAETAIGAEKRTTAANFDKGNGELILVVEDEASIRRITRMVLEKNNYRVLEANDGTEALAIFAQQMDAIDAVFTDMMLPYMDGVALIRALKKMKTDVVFIASTGQAEEPRVTELQELGVTNFLAKPYDSGKLLSAIGSLFRRG
jgi:PAS domain S-box-containing protein